MGLQKGREGRVKKKVNTCPKPVAGTNRSSPNRKGLLGRAKGATTLKKGRKKKKKGEEIVFNRPEERGGTRGERGRSDTGKKEKKVYREKVLRGPPEGLWRVEG